MSSGRSSTSAGRSAAEKVTAKAISPEGSDSGYGSTANATDGSITDHSQDFVDGVAVRSRGFFERKVTKLRLFDREIPQSTQDRFHDLHELFERALCDHLIEAKINPYPISVKLKCLGESEATAKHWIVVLCNKTASKRVRHFFNQQHIKADYQPSNPDPFLPSFEIFVCNRAPRPMAGAEIYGDLGERSTTCGRIIKVGEAHQCRFATLGGVIRVTKPSGTVTFYGMTAGHILAQQPLGQYDFDQVDINDEGDEEDEGYDSGEEEYELDDTFEGEEEAQDLVTTDNTTRTFSQSAQLGPVWPKIGSVFAASNEGAITGQDHDWALVEFVRVTDYLPNLLVPSNREKKTAKHRPLKENGKSTEDGSNRKVFLLSGTSGVKSGTLSTSLSFLMMGPAKAVAKTYTLVLPPGSMLNAGDCGSWVVDESTCEVYGHVVASDAMGDIYVVPLNATLRDMEKKLGAAVSLPTEADIHTWLAQQTKAAAEQITVPAGSKRKNVAFNDSKTDDTQFPQDLQKLTGHSSSQTSTPLALSTSQSSTPIVDYCNLCNARLEAPSQQVLSVGLLRHQRICSKLNKHTALEIESPTARDAKESLDERSKSSSLKHSNNVHQTAASHTSTQQRSPPPWSIRSMYSNFKKYPVSDSQPKGKSKVNSVSNPKEDKIVGSVSSSKPAETTSPTSTAKDLRKDAKKSNTKKNSSPSSNKELPAPLAAVPGRIKGDLSSTPRPDPRASPPTAPPLLSSLPEYGRFSVSPPGRRAPSPVHRHESFHGSISNSRDQSHNSSSGQVSYEGYTFTKCDTHLAGQKETWAVARMVPMPVSQKDLKDQINRNRKRHVSALDEYNDEKMKGFKRKQVDNLIRERTKVDGDYGYEYVLASIKLDSRKTKGKSTDTVSMQVILKRQLIAGLPHETPAGPSTDFHTKLPGQVMDLTSGDELGMFRDYDGGSQDVGHRGSTVPFAGFLEQGASPMIVGASQPFGQGVQHFDKGILPLHAAPHPLEPIHSPAQGMRQPPHPHSGSLVHQNTHNLQGHLEKVDKCNPKNNAPKLVHIRRESRIEHDYASSSSAELDSDNSWTKTDATPDTIFKDQSREHRNAERSRKESKERSRNKARSELTSSAHKIVRPVYREYRRREPRCSSLSPARRSRDVSSDSFDLDLERHGPRPISLWQSHGTRYRDLDYYEIESANSVRADHSSRYYRSNRSPELPSHRRALSYDLGRPPAHNSSALVSVHRETPRDLSHDIDLYTNVAERRREQERWDWDIERLQQQAIERDARAIRRREMWREIVRNDAIMERPRDMERTEQKREQESMKYAESGEKAVIERESRLRDSTYNDRDLPRHRRDQGYYYIPRTASFTMQEASYGEAKEPSEPFSRATHANNSIAEDTVASAGPQIVLRRSESLEGSWRPAVRVQGSHGLGRSSSSEYSSSRESLVLDDPAIGDLSDVDDVPKSIECFFNITFDGVKASAAAISLAIDYTESNSYQSVEKVAQDIAQDYIRASSTGILVPRQFNFKYGNCTVIGDRVEKIGLPLTTREDWESVCAILKNYWRSDPFRALHVEIYRDYFSYHSRAASEVSLVATKRREMHNLIKNPLGNEPYIPRTALMRFNSPQNIREIIIQDGRLEMEPKKKEQFIQTVKSSAPCLLALCVYAELKMECLNLFLQRGFSDAALPMQIKDCCHDKCAPNFSTFLRVRGGFMPARFDKLGEHQDFHHTVVIPIHFVPVEEDQDEVMRAGRQRDLEEGRGSTTSVTDDAKQSACCGLGAYSNVYRVRIDPDHHRLSENKTVDFALKEFKDRPNRGDHDFQRELKILDELRKYHLRHIVTHLATWTHQGRYYMLFPYAQCNLRQYMKWVQFGAPTKEMIIWLIRQFRGLAEALKGIHDLSGADPLQSTPDLITRPVGEKRAGYHHDLKPENILFYEATGDFEISDFGSGKVHTYRSGSHNTPSPHGTLTYEPPEAGIGGTSRPYDMWSLGCVFLELLIWAVLGFPAVEEFRKNRLDRRFPGSLTAIHEDDAFWQMLPNGDVTLRKAVKECTKALREAILQQRNQPFKEILDLVIKMLDTDKETRIPALDLYDTLDRIYKQKRIDLKNVGDGSLPDSNNAQEGSPALLRLSMDPSDRRSSERAREGAATTVRNVTGDFLTVSPISPASPFSPRGSHRRNSSTSEFVGRSRNPSIASSNMSTHGRRGSTDEQHN